MSVSRLARACRESLFALCLWSVCATAHAGALYKCTIGGKSKYQDTPCTADAEQSERASGDRSSLPARQLATPDLLAEIRTTEERIRALDAEHRLKAEQMQRHYQDAGDYDGYYREVARLQEEWALRSAPVNRRRDELRAEFQKRCPSGYYGAANRCDAY